MRATSTAPTWPTGGPGGAPSGAPGRREEVTTRAEVLRLGREVDAWRAAGDLEPIRRLAGADYFAPAKYVLAGALGEALPEDLAIDLASEVPRAGGLGSGGAAFAALATALAAWTEDAGAYRIGADGTGSESPQRREQVGGWAHRGDVVAHGGVASRLDTQTSLCGGVIRFAVAAGIGAPVPYDPALPLVIGDTGTVARTSEVNSRLRAWLDLPPGGQDAPLRGHGGPRRRGPGAPAYGGVGAAGALDDPQPGHAGEDRGVQPGDRAPGGGGPGRGGPGGQAGRLRRGRDHPGPGPARAPAGGGAGDHPRRGAALTPALAVPGAHVLPAEGRR